MARKKKRKGKRKGYGVQIGMPQMSGVTVGAPRLAGVTLGTPRIVPTPKANPEDWPEPSEEEIVGNEVLDPDVAAAWAEQNKPMTQRQRQQLEFRRKYPEEAARYLLANTASMAVGRQSERPSMGILTEKEREEIQNWLNYRNLREDYGVPTPSALQAYGVPAFAGLSPADRAVVMTRKKKQ